MVLCSPKWGTSLFLEPITFPMRGAQLSVWFISWKLEKIIETAEWYWRCKQKQVDTSVCLRNKVEVNHALKDNYNTLHLKRTKRAENLKNINQEITNPIRLGRHEISAIFHTHMCPSCCVVLLLNMIDITTVNDQGKNEIYFDQARLPVWSMFTKKMNGYITRQGIMSQRNSLKD